MVGHLRDHIAAVSKKKNYMFVGPFSGMTIRLGQGDTALCIGLGNMGLSIGLCCMALNNGLLQGRQSETGLFCRITWKV